MVLVDVWFGHFALRTKLSQVANLCGSVTVFGQRNPFCPRLGAVIERMRSIDVNL